MFLGERLMIEKYLGISSDYVIIGLAGLVLITMILLIVYLPVYREKGIHRFLQGFLFLSVLF